MVLSASRFFDLLSTRYLRENRTTPLTRTTPFIRALNFLDHPAYSDHSVYSAVGSTYSSKFQERQRPPTET